VKLSNLTPSLAIIITAGALVGIGILKTAGLLDGDFANTVVAFVLGGGSGAALTGGFSKGGAA
jgi:hypothetical protein